MDTYTRASKLYHSAKPENAEEAIDLLLQNALQHPEDGKAWFELAGCYDYLGREQDALNQYLKVKNLGIQSLPEEDRPRLYLQWGSTLRNLGRLEESRTILFEGAHKFPEMRALKAFLALTQYSLGAFKEAAQALFILLHSKYPDDSSMEHFARAFDWYIDHLDAPPSTEGARQSELD